MQKKMQNLSKMLFLQEFYFKFTKIIALFIFYDIIIQGDVFIK